MKTVDNTKRAAVDTVVNRGRVTLELPRSTRPSVPSLIGPSSPPPQPMSSPAIPPAMSPRPRPPPRPVSFASMPASASRISLPPTMAARAAPHVPAVPSTCEPRLAYRSWFTGALLPVCDVEVLIVVVQPRIMFDTYEANLFVTAFNLRFKRTIVLLSQDEQTLVPTLYGPAGIVRALSALPFEMIPWQRMLYRVAKPAAWTLPIPPERPADDSSFAHTSAAPTFELSSLEDLARTRIRDPGADDIRNAAERSARTTRR